MPLANGRRWRQQFFQGVVGETLLLGLRPEVGRIARGEVRVTRGEQVGVALLGAAVGRRRGESLAGVRARQRERDEVEVAYGERIGGRHGHVIVRARARHRYREVRVEAFVRRGVGAREIRRVAVRAHGEPLDADRAGARHGRPALGLGVPGEPTLARVGVVATSRRRRLLVRPVHQQTVLHAARLHDFVLLPLLLPQVGRAISLGTALLLTTAATAAAVLEALLRGATTHLAVLLHRARVRPRWNPVEGHLAVVRQTGEFAGRTGRLSQPQRLHGSVLPAVRPLMAGLRLPKFIGLRRWYIVKCS